MIKYLFLFNYFIAISFITHLISTMHFQKNILSILLCLLCSFNAIAQKKDSLQLNTIKIPDRKFYYQLGVGYHFSAGVGTLQNYKENKDGSSSIQNMNGSWGKGIDIGFGFGVKITKSMAFELELGGVVGGKNKEENQYYVTTFSTPYTLKESSIFKANTFRFNPKIVFEVPIKGENAFYGKIGYLIGFGNAKEIIDAEAYYNSGQKGTGSYEWKISGGIVSGSTMALGFRIKTEEDISFFMEITGNNLHRTFTESSMVESVENGQNTLNTRSIYSKEVIYVDKVETPAGTPDPTKPRQLAAYRASYSSVGFRIGFVRHF
jgi:hypothetical protein